MGFLKKAWHWLMIGCMVSMVFMAGHMALMAHAANTSFLNIAGSYLGHIWTGITQSAGPALKAFGVAGKNLLATFGIGDPVSTTNLAITTPPPGATEVAGHAAGHTMGAKTSMAAKTAAVTTPPPPLTETFMSQFEKLAPNLQEQFRQQAQRFGLSLEQVAGGYCAPYGP